MIRLILSIPFSKYFECVIDIYGFGVSVIVDGVSAKEGAEVGEDAGVLVGKVGVGELVVVEVGRSICMNISGAQPMRPSAS